MGYYVQLKDSTFRIPDENLVEAAARLKALNHKPGVYKQGGAYGGPNDGQKWFSWMEPDYDEIYDTAQEILEALGFYCIEYDDGSLLVEGYDNKTGQEDLFIAEIADLAVEGWEMIWQGEDGNAWKHNITGIKQGKLVFEE